jgi:beta-fructofuranosidase
MSGKLHKGFVVKDWRDPFVWKEGAEYRVVLGGHRDGGKGCALLYRSPDLLRWQFLSTLAEGKEGNWECPNFFKLGDKWVLVYSPHGIVRYQVGTLDGDNHFKPETEGVLDLSGTYYAPNSMLDGKGGRRLMWGWLRVKGAGWNGMLTLPRVLTLRPDGRLAMQPAPELQALRGKQHHFSEVTLTPGGANPLKDVRGDCLEVLLECEPGDAATVGLRLRLRRSAEGREQTVVLFDRAKKQLQAGEARGAFELGKDEKALRLHVFLDRSVLEVYANGRECASSPVSARGKDSLGAELFCTGGPVKVRSLDVWEMKQARDGPP